MKDTFGSKEGNYRKYCWVFLWDMLYFDEPVGQVAIQTTHKNTQWYNTPELLILYIILLYIRITMETLMVKSIQSITVAVEVDMITQYLQQILGYHVKFKVCQVSKPLICVVFANFCILIEKHLLLQIVWKIFNKTIIECNQALCLCFGR